MYVLKTLSFSKFFKDTAEATKNICTIFEDDALNLLARANGFSEISDALPYILRTDILTQQFGDGTLLIEHVMGDVRRISAVSVGQFEQSRVLLVLLAGRHGVQFAQRGR